METPIGNKDYVPSFLILKWQAGTCDYRLIPNKDQIDLKDEEYVPEEETGTELPF